MIDREALKAAEEYLRVRRAEARYDAERAVRTVLDGLDFYRSLAVSHECELSRRDQKHEMVVTLT